MVVIHRATPWIFFVLALTSGLLLVWTTPPFLMADEQTHFMRADIMTSGPAALGHSVVSGQEHVTGRIHTAIVDAAQPFERIKFHADQKVQAADLASARTPTLDGRRSETFPGQALDPAFYLPSAAAVAWGRHFGWRVLDALYLARTLNLLTSVLLGGAALVLARQARLPLYAVLMLPMSMALFASVTQDGPMIGVAALAAAIFSRAMGEDRPLTRFETMAAALCLAAVGIAKAPYALFALLLLVAPARDRRTQVLSAVWALAIPLLWNAWMLVTGWAAPGTPGSDTDPATQVLRLFQSPGYAVALIQETSKLGVHFAEQLVGVLGWLDTALPSGFYTAAYWVLGAALLAPAAFRAPGWRLFRLLVAPVTLLGAAGVFLAMYLTWTPAGAVHIEGVQGRYLIPLALMLPLTLEGPKPLLSGDRLRAGLQAAISLAVLAFPLVSLVVTQLALIDRYYMR